MVKVDDPPAGKVVPIGKFDGDGGATRNPNDSGIPAVHPQPVDQPQVPEVEPDIEPVHGIAIGELSPAEGNIDPLVDPRSIPISDDESGEVVPVLTPKEDVEDPDDRIVRVGPGTGQLIDPLLATGTDVEATGEVVNQPFFSVAGTIIPPGASPS